MNWLSPFIEPLPGEILRVTTGRKAQPSAALFDSRTLQSTPESGARAEYDGAKRKKGGKTHIAVDTLGNLLALLVTPARRPRRRARLAIERKRRLGRRRAKRLNWRLLTKVIRARAAERQAAEYGLRLEVIKLAEAKKGFALLPRRWVVRLGGATLADRARDYERLPETLAGLHFLAFAILMLKRFVEVVT